MEDIEMSTTPYMFEKVNNIHYDMFHDGKPKLVKNIFNKSVVVDAFMQNPNSHYEYTIKDGETPQIIAELYYDDSNYYWVILMMNDIVNYRDEWPLSTAKFDAMINSKYKTVKNAESQTIHYYDKQWNTIISKETYDRMKERKDPAIEKYERLNALEMENIKNEKNRVIRLLRKRSLTEFVERFAQVMKD